ncbi:MAG: hypothetical protein A2Y17_06340 [Clostridiales bacterium GWF2_38_85]|nr:MAG: hypothetical protein A2Y17_06340 [Clostridiales bacterium GWF2_38_85]HBL85512.1 metallophosphoesterase [Clostridiales bacterium]
MRILAIGDVSGNCGVEAIEKMLRPLKTEYDADIVIVNGENSSERNGIDKSSAERLFNAGADVLTGGNHSMRNKEIYSYMDDNQRLLRPINFGNACAGSGHVIIDTAFGRLLVICAAGQIYMDPADSPFAAVDKLLDSEKGKYDVAIADIHAEATSEKEAFARYFDGRIQVVFGTHTHVQTSNEKILQNGCGFITDIGMCGAADSILGVKSEAVIGRMVNRTPERFLMADGEARIDGALFVVDAKLNRTVKIERFSRLC